MERERDYSMMITHKPWWLGLGSVVNGKKAKADLIDKKPKTARNAQKCEIIHKETGDRIKFNSLEEVDIYLKKASGMAASACRQGWNINKIWKVVKL